MNFLILAKLCWLLADVLRNTKLLFFFDVALPYQCIKVYMGIQSMLNNAHGALTSYITETTEPGIGNRYKMSSFETKTKHRIV